MRTLSLSPIAALVACVQVLSPATAQGLDEIYQDEQNQEQIKQELCRTEFDSAQFAGLSSGRRTGSRYKIDFNSSKVLEIIVHGTGCRYPYSEYKVFGKKAKADGSFAEYQLKIEGKGLVLYERLAAGSVQRRVIGIMLHRQGVDEVFQH